MTLAREQTVAGLEAELAEFEALIRSLSDDEWDRTSRCGGWSAGDVAKHVTGQLADVVAGRFDALGQPDATQRQVDERRGQGPSAVADELAQARAGASAIANAIDDAAWEGPGPVGGSLGSGVEALWFDAYVHADDIRDAVGRAPEMGPGLIASSSHIAQILTDQGYRPVTLALDGQDEYAVAGGGERVTGDPHQFMLVATGRLDPALLGLDPAVNIYR
jgi:uncharacterized protein (TIGR03083 family)